MRRGARWALLVGVASAALAALPAASAAKQHYRVDVVRDSAGIPHVTARNFRSLGYGEGYAYAQDNLCLFADAIVTVRGERSKYFGAGGTAYYYSNNASDPNLASDAFWKWVRASGQVDHFTDGFGKKPTALYRGWAAGYNAYLESGRLKDPSCKGEPWVRPIRFKDLLLRGLQIEIGASSGVLISELFDAQPPAAAARPRAAAATVDPGELERRFDQGGDSELGSNGLALGSEATKHGDGLLLANPHFPWRGVDRFWMAHLTVPGKYDAMGGTLGGFPMIGVGFNRKLAWTHTVSTGRRFAIMQLQLAPGDPTSYVVDGQTIPMTRTTVDVEGTPHTFYGTQYGLVMTLPSAGYSWTDTTAYALLDANLGNTRVANQYLKMGGASGVRDLLRIEERGRGIPFFNTIAADSRGRAMYADVGRYPNVPQSLIDACLPAGGPQLVFTAARVITLDGSRAQCVPQGLLPADAMPRLVRRDYVENSNDSFWLANPAAPITGITPLIGLANTIQGVRTRQGNLMVQDRLRSGRKFTVSSLQGMWQNDRSYLAELVSHQLAALCRANPSVTLPDSTVVDVSEGCPVLDAYDQTGNLDSKGAWLFAAYQRRAPSGTSFWSDPFNPADPLNTPTQLDGANPDQLIALGEAVRELRDHGIPLDSPLRGVQVATRGKKRISIHGCGQCFQNINSSNGSSGSPAFGAPYGEVIQGSSMVLTTELTPQGPHSEGILTYSQATDPTSPWYANMTKFFSRKQWVQLRFDPDDLATDRGATAVKVPGAR